MKGCYILKKTSDIHQKFTKIVVGDYFARKRFFLDSEVIGWLIVEEENSKPIVYHLYQRGNDEETNEEFDDPCIFPFDPLSEKEIKDDIEKIRFEVETQYQTGENKNLKKRVNHLLQFV